MKAETPADLSPGPLSGGPLAAVTLVVAVLAIGLPSLTLPMGSDQSILAYGGWRTLQGDVVGIDWQPMKPPGAYYLCAVAQATFGHTVTSIRWLDLLWSLATALSLFALARHWFGTAVGLVAGLLWSWSYATAYDFWHSAQFDGFLTLPVIGVLALADRGLADRRPRWWLGAGALLAQAFMIKYTVLTFGIALVAALWLSRCDDGSRGRVIGPLVWTAAGFALGLLPWLALLAPLGAIGPLVEIQRNMNAGYTVASFSRGLGEFWWWMKYGVGWFLRTHLAVIALAAVGFIALLRRRDRAAPLVIGWLLAALIGYLGQLKFFFYHSLPLLAPLAVLGALGLAKLARWLGRARLLSNPRRAWAVAIALLVLTQGEARRRWWASWKDMAQVLSADTTREDLWRELPPYDRTSLSDLIELADRLAAETSESDTVYIWGYQPLVHFLSERPSPTRFVHNPMLTIPWGDPAWREELIRDLRGKRPSHIIICRDDAIPWATGVEEDSETLFEEFEALRTLVRSEYDLAWVTPRFRVYRRRG